MNLKSKIESLLFVSGSPMDISKLAKLSESKKEEVKIAVEKLKSGYEDSDSGLRIAVVENKYQLVTSPLNTKEVQGFLKQEIIGELTRPQLETLTIIAYRCPVSKIDLEQIRGVNCTMILRNLMIRGLIEPGELQDGMDTYKITHEFLKHLGVSDIAKLPDYEKLNANKNVEDLLSRGEDNNLN